jgi:hypothetical protein
MGHILFLQLGNDGTGILWREIAEKNLIVHLIGPQENRDEPRNDQAKGEKNAHLS